MKSGGLIHILIPQFLHPATVLCRLIPRDTGRCCSNRVFRKLVTAVAVLTSVLRWNPGPSSLSGSEVSRSENSASAQIRALFDDDWQRTLRGNPAYASQLGDRRYNRLWPDASVVAFEQSLNTTREALRKIRAVDRSLLTKSEKLNCRLFERHCEAAVTEQSSRLFLLVIDQRTGIQEQSSLALQLQFESVRDYEDWIARMKGFPLLVAQHMALMKQGIREGLVHPRIVMQRVPSQIRRQLVGRPEDSQYYHPFRAFAVEISESEQRRLRTLAVRTIESSILPAYRVFLEFFEKEYLPACGESVGCWARPQGQQMYADLVRKFTTTDLRPDEIHQLGLQEVDRIQEQMEQLRSEIAPEKSLAECLAFMRSEPEFYFSSADDLLNAYRDCIRRIEPELPRLFLRLPKAGCTVQSIPAHLAPDVTTAFYRAPAFGGDRSGIFFVNLHRPEVCPRYEIEALSLHEAMPGHHLQTALAMELTDLPEFRLYGGSTAFIEGWALYSETLGAELGLFKDPWSKFGQLNLEMWRAVRLVVDTGLHSRKWSREQAIDFLAARTARALADVENEIDRYITCPGQALAYKVGELKIRELRRKAEETLGARFDLRAFHNEILIHGALPLDILEELFHEWLTNQQIIP
jgi:uncharacterized protein (DUF885 family)